MDAESTGGCSARFAPTISFVPDSPGRVPRIDLNRATAAELLPLPGVDKVRAGRIVAARAERRFAHVDELLSRGVVPPSVFARIRGRVRADFMDEPYLTGVVPKAGALWAAKPAVLEVRFEDSQPGVRLVRLQAQSVSHALDLSRAVTPEERRRGVITFELPAMAEGVMNVQATLYDGAGGRDAIASTVNVLPSGAGVSVLAYPTGRSLRTVSGAARPTPQGDFICSAGFIFGNATGAERRLRGRVEWTATAYRWITVSGYFDWGRQVVVPPGGISSGWYVDIRFLRSSSMAGALRSGSAISIRYRFTEVSGAVHEAVLTWRVFMGPHVNVIYVGAEGFPEVSRTELLRSIDEVTRDIYGAVDIGIGRIQEVEIPVAQAGRFVTLENDGEARDLTNAFTVPNDGMDLFVVREYLTHAGASETDGPCDKEDDWLNPKDMSGSVVKFTLFRAGMGQLIAHELAHYLGLSHVPPWAPGAENYLMHPTANANATRITASQAAKMREHCFMKILG